MLMEDMSCEINLLEMLLLRSLLLLHLLEILLYFPWYL